MAFNLPALPELDNPLLGFRFGVFFLGPLGIPNLLDFRFQSVSGFSVDIQTGKLDGSETSIAAGSFPISRSYSNLVLKRGMPTLSILRHEILDSFHEFQFHPRNVLLTILDENVMPLSSWIFEDAYPVKWSLSDLDASQSAIIVEEMHLSYRRFKSMLP